MTRRRTTFDTDMKLLGFCLLVALCCWSAATSSRNSNSRQLQRRKLQEVYRQLTSVKQNLQVGLGTRRCCYLYSLFFFFFFNGVDTHRLFFSLCIAAQQQAPEHAAQEHRGKADSVAVDCISSLCLVTVDVLPLRVELTVALPRL